MRRLLLALLSLAILAVPLVVGLIYLPWMEGTSPTSGKLNPVERSSATMAKTTVARTYHPDELYDQLKNHPQRGPTVPPFFLEAWPLERLRDLANLKELSAVYWGAVKSPETFYTHYVGEGKSLGVAVAVVRPDSTFSAEGIVDREKRYVRQEQNSAVRTWEIALVPLGDFGYLQINKLTPENVPAGFLPPGVPASVVQEVAQLVFIKGEVWVSIITYGGFVEPEQLVEIAGVFEELLSD